MSARPDVPRLAEEDLDLLVSRSLDGDLSPEEEQQLDRLVALDPAAARRKAELSALVADVKTLPEPATPFALATRVSSNVAERAGRAGSLGGRLGLFPAPGFAKAALVILGIVGASIAILRPAPKRLAEGPVDVFLYNPPGAPPAARVPESVVSEVRPDSSRRQAPRPEGREDKARRNEADEQVKTVSDALEKTGAKKELAVADAPAEAVLVADAALKLKDQKADHGDLDGAAAVPAPAKAANAGALGAAQAPAAPAPVVATQAPRGWTVSVRGDAARRWSLRRAPDNPPPAREAAVYRVTLDASGRVVALHRVGAGAADLRLDAFVRGMVFEARAAARDLPTPSGDVEIGLEPR